MGALDGLRGIFFVSCAATQTGLPYYVSYDSPVWT